MNTPLASPCPRFRGSPVPTLCLGALLALAPNSLLRAQTAVATAAKEAAIELNPFLVNADAPGRYQVNESSSGGRISQNIMDSSSTIATLSRDMIDDLGAGNILKSARFISGITDSTIADALDRITIRGFQTDGQRIDGFTYEGQLTYDQASVDRIEVVKGPNALLLPSGTPGGTINLVSKSPKFKKQGYLTVQGGQYDANRAELDYTAPVTDKFAYRLVTAYQDSKGYNKRSFHDSLDVSPSFTFRPSSTAQLTVHLQYVNFRMNSSSIPVDLATVGTNTPFAPLPGIPLNFSIAGPGDFRKERRESAWFLFTGKISDSLSVRFAGRASQIAGPTNGWGFGPNVPGGAINPLTGIFTAGIVYGPAPTFTPSPAPAITSWSHTGTYQTNIYRREDLQNDYVYQYDTDFMKTTTLAGLAYGYYSNNRISTNGSLPAVANPWTAAYDPNFDTSTVVWAAPNTNQQLRYSQLQKYVTESISLFKNRVVINGGIANFSFDGYIVNKIGTGTPLSPGHGDANTVNYGLVIKPLPNVALYAGHTENAAPTTSFQTVAAGLAPKFSIGLDNEFGVKAQFLDQRLFVMVDHYNIHQTAFGIGNPLNNTVPPPPVLLPTLYSNRTASGWEYQMTGSLTKQLSVSANYTNFKNRDPNNIPFRTTAEKSGGIYVHYGVTEGSLKGFAAGVGVNYMAKSPGDAASGYTTAPTPVPNQPTFYYPAHTITDVNFSYASGRQIYRLNLYNLTDEVYWAGGGSRTGSQVGNPRSASGSVTYKF